MSAEFKFIHHACFTVTAGGETLIIFLFPMLTATTWAAPMNWPNSATP